MLKDILITEGLAAVHLTEIVSGLVRSLPTASFCLNFCMSVLFFYVIVVAFVIMGSLQCFDTTVLGIASGLYKFTNEVLAWLSVWSEVHMMLMPLLPHHLLLH